MRIKASIFATYHIPFSFTQGAKNFLKNDADWKTPSRLVTRGNI